MSGILLAARTEGCVTRVKGDDPTKEPLPGNETTISTQ